MPEAPDAAGVVVLPPIPDFVPMIKRVAVDPELRPKAGALFESIIAEKNPLVSDHGTHLLRFSNFGGCSAALVAGALGLNDLARTDDLQMTLDAGTILGVWLACLMKVGFDYGESLPGSAVAQVILEHPALYRETPGSVDAILRWDSGAAEIVEFKTTQGTGKIAPPDVKKLNQCLQAGGYGLDPTIAADRFTVVTWGPNVTGDKFGNPYPRMAQHTYSTRHYKPLVDAEIDRLSALAPLTKTDLMRDLEALADTADAFRCKSCLFSACPRNVNPAKYEL